MRIRSLHTQVILVLVVLTTTLAAQLLLSRNSLSTLFHDQEVILQSSDNVGLVYELERDVINLQRTLLIYKATASETSSKKFFGLMTSVKNKLITLEGNSLKNTLLTIDKTLIKRMGNHLNDYQENFSSVVTGRSKRDELVSGIKKTMKALADKLSNATLVNKTLLFDIKLHFSQMNNSFNEYLISPDLEYSDKFKNESNQLKNILVSVGHYNLEIKVLNKLSKNIFRLTQVTRGYVFLVNVVMAGSANEFLYLTEKIRGQVTASKSDLIIVTKNSGEVIRTKYNVIAVISLIIIVMIAWFLSKRIFMPIREITQVFRVLSKGDEIDSIPSTNRRDEIGDLAKSAEVFHEKNKLTHDLLEKSQDMISNQEVLNIQLEAEKDRAEQAAKSKSMFLANMSHEIRTPMNGIVGLVDLVLKTKLDKKQVNYLHRIAYSGQIMMNVINDILDFSKIEAGKLEIEHVDFDIDTVIENLISAMSVRIEDKKLDFRVLVSNDVPLKLKGDALRISQVLLNLCSNSVKFTEQGFLQVSFDYTKSERSLCVEVKDTGIGMNEKQLSSIFQSFTQADGSTSRKYGGTGLGLTIVKQLVGLMEGEVNVTSKESEGTIVNIKIKVASVDDCPEDKPIIAIDGVINLLTEMKADLDAKTLCAQYASSVKEIDHEHIESIFMNENKDQILIIEPLALEFLQENNEFIAKCISLKIKLGFVLQSSANKTKAYIEEHWKMEVLQHPYSPRQCKHYFNNLLNVSHSLIAVNEVDETTECINFKGHILLVEDNQINQLVAGDMLESMGLTYDVAEDGLQAVDKIQPGHGYDLVLMDVQMPKMDGYTATKTIRKAGFDSLIICGLSANALKEDLDRAKLAGMNDYLTKPLQVEIMKSALGKYLPFDQPSP